MLRVKPFDELAAERYGRMRPHLDLQRAAFGPLVMFIAGQALALDCTLITANTREFSRVQGLRTGNWF